MTEDPYDIGYEAGKRDVLKEIRDRVGELWADADCDDACHDNACYTYAYGEALAIIDEYMEPDAGEEG